VEHVRKSAYSRFQLSEDASQDLYKARAFLLIVHLRAKLEINIHLYSQIGSRGNIFWTAKYSGHTIMYNGYNIMHIQPAHIRGQLSLLSELRETIRKK